MVHFDAVRGGMGADDGFGAGAVRGDFRGGCARRGGSEAAGVEMLLPFDRGPVLLRKLRGLDRAVAGDVE